MPKPTRRRAGKNAGGRGWSCLSAPLPPPPAPPPQLYNKAAAMGGLPKTMDDACDR